MCNPHLRLGAFICLLECVKLYSKPECFHIHIHIIHVLHVLHVAVWNLTQRKVCSENGDFIPLESIQYQMTASVHFLDTLLCKHCVI